MQMLRYDPKERITAHEALRHDFFRMGAAATPPSNGRVRPEKKETSATAEPAEAAVLGLGGSVSGASQNHQIVRHLVTKSIYGRS